MKTEVRWTLLIRMVLTSGPDNCPIALYNEDNVCSLGTGAKPSCKVSYGAHEIPDFYMGKHNACLRTFMHQGFQFEHSGPQCS